jgi:hypothetical protein
MAHLGDYYERIYRRSDLLALTSSFRPLRMWARLILNRDGVDLVAHELVADVITVGRASLNHVVIDDATVSAQHAMLMRVGHSCRLRDLRSTNGTQVNEVAITEAELKDGDKIRFGSAVAIFARCARKT